MEENEIIALLKRVSKHGVVCKYRFTKTGFGHSNTLSLCYDEISDNIAIYSTYYGGFRLSEYGVTWAVDDDQDKNLLDKLKER